VVRAAGFPVVLWVHMAVEGARCSTGSRGACGPDLAICNSEFTRRACAAGCPSVETEVVYGRCAGGPTPAGEPRRDPAALDTPRRRRAW
jgi:hypothetical protein